jgi:molybdate/tungstate transport system substrate-binding protein
LIIPVNQIEQQFEAENPDIDVQNECHGSIQVIRHVTDIHKKIDVVATADYSLIPMLMYSAINPDTGEPYGNWAMKFATNELALAFQDESNYASEINSENWWEIITRPDVRIGLADPRFDASGYRALMAMKLAEEFYDRPTILFNFLDGQLKFPITATINQNQSILSIPEIIATKENNHVVIRGSSIQLISLLEAGDLDYAFEYRSVINQHHLKILELPDEINLGNENLNAFYSQVKVVLDFQRFNTVKPEFTGEQIGYGITIPSNAPHPEAAARYIAFLFSQSGRQIMKSNSQEVFQSIIVDQPENLPVSLRNINK